MTAAMQGEIKNMIFDLGGVLLNVDYQAPVKAFEQLGIRDFDQLYSKAQQSDLFDELETGKISPGVFRNTIRQQTGCTIDDTTFDRAWNSILLDLPPGRVQLLRALKKKYRLFLLSNTNAIHIAAFEQDIIRQFGHNVFDELFERHYYSSDLGLRKPHRETFEKVMALNGLAPSETLFIDDSPQHIAGARSAGLHTIWLDVKHSDIEKEMAGFV